MKQTLRTSLLALSLLAATTPALALHVDDPTVDEGEFEIGYKSERFGDDDASDNNKQKHLLEFEYGFTDDFSAALLLQGKRNSSDSFHASGFGVEAIYELTEQGEWWLSSGIYGEYLHAARDEDTDEIEGKILLKREDAEFQTTVNLIAERGIGGGRERGIEIESIVESIYEVGHYVNPGVEWVAEWGSTDHDFGDNQEHYLGPILTGDLLEFEIGKGQAAEIEYVVGYLWGLNDDSADNAIRFELEFETEF